MVEPGIIFFVGLLGLACLFLRRAAMIEALEQHGMTVVATITSIDGRTRDHHFNGDHGSTLLSGGLKSLYLNTMPVSMEETPNTSAGASIPEAAS